MVVFCAVMGGLNRRHDNKRFFILVTIIKRKGEETQTHSERRRIGRLVTISRTEIYWLIIFRVGAIDCQL